MLLLHLSYWQNNPLCLHCNHKLETSYECVIVVFFCFTDDLFASYYNDKDGYRFCSSHFYLVIVDAVLIDVLFIKLVSAFLSFSKVTMLKTNMYAYFANSNCHRAEFVVCICLLQLSFVWYLLHLFLLLHQVAPICFFSLIFMLNTGI